MSDQSAEATREELSAACYNERQHDGDIGMEAESGCYCIRCCAVRYLAATPDKPSASDEEVIGLLNEVMQGHRTPNSPDYNECELSLCKWCEDATNAIAAIQAARTAPLAEVGKLQDQLDLNRDEFLRIQAAPGCTDEIAELCERSQLRITQNVPLIKQRDMAINAAIAEKAQRNDYVSDLHGLVMICRGGKSEITTVLGQEILAKLQAARAAPSEDTKRLLERAERAEKWLNVFVYCGDGESLWHALERQHGDKYETAYGWERKAKQRDLSTSEQSTQP